jgi:hypothetical protein
MTPTRRLSSLSGGVARRRGAPKLPARLERGQRRRNVLRSLASAAILTLALGSPAAAGNPNAPVPIGDDGVALTGTTYVEDTPLPWKTRLVALHREMRAGRMSQAEADEYNALVDANAVNPGGHIAKATASSSGASATSMAAAAVAHYVTQTQRPQTKDFYCGPAAAQSVVLAWHAEKFYGTNSAKEPAKTLTQDNLGGPDYTNADSKGRTDFAKHDMSRAINNWLFYPYAYYVEYSPSSVTTLQDHVTTDLDIDWMMASDTIERANNASLHFNHHPLGRDIYHWTTIYGYSTSGTTFSLQDSGANSPALGSDWDAVLPYFSMSSTKTYNLMMKNGIASRGIAW